MRGLTRRAFALAFALMLAVSPLAVSVSAYNTGHADIASFEAEAEGTELVLSLSGSTWWAKNDLVFRYADGTSDSYLLIVENGGVQLKTSDWQEVASGGRLERDGESYRAEARIPLSMLRGDEFTMTLAGVSVSSAELGLSAGGAAEAPAGEENGAEEPAAPAEETPAEEAATEETPVEETPAEEAPAEELPAEAETPAAAETSAATAASLTPNASGRITVDGSLSDWAGIAALTNTSAQIDEWKLARDTEGNVYLAYSGTATTQWDYTYTGKMLVLVQNGKTQDFQVAQVGNATWSLRETGSYEVVNEANHNTAGPYAVEVMIPAANFTDPDFMIGLGDSTDTAVRVSAANIPVLDGREVETATEAVYNGIAIDGSFADWAAVEKQDVTDKDPNNTLREAAMVFDGDMVYIYLREQPGMSAGGAGSHSNGKFSIGTDLGFETLFTLGWSSEISGIEDAKASHVGDEWEIAVPKSNLQNYLRTISLGLYQGETFVDGVANLDGSTGDPGGSGDGGSWEGIVYDGLYGDWAELKHHIIQYATAGTQENVRDASGALYAEGSDLYGHVVTTMPAHTENEHGSEFGYAVTIRFNDNADLDFYPMLVEVDANGNINWNTGAILANLPEGQTKEFYIACTDAWHTSANINSLTNAKDTMYGKMSITRSQGKDECEFWLDLTKIADKHGMDASEFKLIAAQFGRIGREWITVAGASSGAWLGVALSCAVAGGTVAYRRRREDAAQ